MTYRHETSVLLADERELHFTQREHESSAEFDGRVLCEIEDAILAGDVRLLVPAGTRWVEWHHRGHPLRAFHAGTLGTLYEATGKAFQGRKKRIPGLYDLHEARVALGLIT